MLTDNGPTDDDLAAYTDDRDPTVHPIDTEALRRLADAATPGPWPLFSGGEYVGGVGILVAPDDGGVSPANAAFIAAARTALPALLDENTALRARATRAEARAEARRRQTTYWQERAQEAGVRTKAVEEFWSDGGLADQIYQHLAREHEDPRPSA